jgi:hypothetical protein
VAVLPHRGRGPRSRPSAGVACHHREGHRVSFGDLWQCGGQTCRPSPNTRPRGGDDLLQQPGGFEGFPRIEKGPNPNRVTVLELEQVGPGRLDLKTGCHSTSGSSSSSRASKSRRLPASSARLNAFDVLLRHRPRIRRTALGNPERHLHGRPEVGYMKGGRCLAARSLGRDPLRKTVPPPRTARSAVRGRFKRSDEKSLRGPHRRRARSSRQQPRRAGGFEANR